MRACLPSILRSSFTKANSLLNSCEIRILWSGSVHQIPYEISVSHSAYNRPDDYVFASIKMHGKQPIWPNSAMEDHIRPAAKRAGITKRIGWHTLRHTFGTLLKANGEDV